MTTRPTAPKRRAGPGNAPASGRILRWIARVCGPVGPAAAWRLSKIFGDNAGQAGRVFPIESGGVRWELDLSDRLQRHIFYTGAYEQPSLRALLRRLRPGDVVLDVGANIGSFALPIARKLDAESGGGVLAVEPATDTFGRLSRHVALNSLEGTVFAHRVALGARTSTRMLRSGSHTGASSWGQRSLLGRGAPVEAVQVVRGDSWLDDLDVPRIDVLKVDVEGFEGEVLAGLSGVLNERPPRLVLLELVEAHQRAGGGSVGDLVMTMRGFGYDGFWIRIRGLVPIEACSHSGNALFVLRTQGRPPHSTDTA